MVLSSDNVQGDAFYGAIATILPVLILALVVDKSRDYKTMMDITDRLSLVFSTTLLVVAGYATLHALAGGHANFEAARIVSASITATIMLLVISVVRQGSARTQEQNSSTTSHGTKHESGQEVDGSVNSAKSKGSKG